MTPLKAVCYIFFTGLNFAVYVYFILAAFQKFLRFSKGKTIFFVFWAFVIGSVLEVLVFEKDSPFHQYLLAGKVLITLVTVLMAVGLVLKKPLQVGFGMFMALTIQNSIITAAEMLTALSPLPVLVAEFPNFNYLLYTIFVLALFVPLLYYLFCRLLRRVMELGMDLRQWGILLLLPFLYFIYEMRSLHCGAVRPPVTWGRPMGPGKCAGGLPAPDRRAAVYLKEPLIKSHRTSCRHLFRLDIAKNP